MMRHHVALAVTLPLLSACLAGGKATPDDRYYQLGRPQVAGQQRAPLVDTLVVRSLRSDGLREERALLYSNDAQAIAVQRFHYHFWADAPPELVGEYVRGFLRASGIARRVIKDTPGRSADYIVGGRLERFEQVRTAGHPVQAIVALELDITGVDGKLLMQRDYQASSEAPADDMTAIVTAFRRALDEVLTRFVGDAASAFSARVAAP